MSDTSSNRLQESLMRDLFVFEDESNPRSSRINRIWPPTVLDQVFDHLSPTRKNLRQILEELRQEIITGGIGNIIFPVTNVNGKAIDGSEIWLSAEDLGLGRVDNTRDADKPLSAPQRSAIMEILSTYNFNVNLSDLQQHLMDLGNPHAVTLEQIDKDEALSKFIDWRIAYHNNSSGSNIHADLRRGLSTLWNRVDEVDRGLEERIADILDRLDNHFTDSRAHFELFEKVEKLTNKTQHFTDTTDNNHTLYPTTRAVVEFIQREIASYNETLPDIEDWISDVLITNTEADLPIANRRNFRQAYLLRNGQGFGERMALAVCRLNNENKTYYWDIKCTGAVSKFDPTFFKETPEGLSLNVPAILATNPQIDELFNTVLTGNYSATSVYDLFIREIKILPGTMDGCIRYYINGDDSTMSDDVRLPGVQRLAFMEYVGEDEIKDNAVHSRHLLNKAVQMRHLADDVVFDSSRLTGDIFKANLFRADRYTLLGNIFNDDRVVHEVGLVQLGDLLRPIIGGWPDPAVPDSLIYGVPLTSPHLWKDNEPQTFADGRLGMRFRGTISVLPNRQITTNLDNQVTTKEHQLIDCGGSWRVNTVTKTDAVLGGSNITGHTFASIQMDQNGITLDSISIGDRQEAFYDVWVVYVPIWRACKHEWIEYTNPSNPTEMLRQCKKCHHKE